MVPGSVGFGIWYFTKKYRKEGFEVESDQFYGTRYIIKGDSLVITSAKNGALAVDLKKGKLLAQEIIEMVEYDEK